MDTQNQEFPGAKGSNVRRPTRPGGPAARKHVMLIARRKGDVNLLETALHCQLFRTSIIEDGWDAYFRAQVERPDIIFIDAALDDMSSLMVARLLKLTRKTASIPLLFLDTPQQGWSRVEAFSVGAVDCIARPWHEQEVLARLQVHLARRGDHRDVPLDDSLHSDDLLWRAVLRALEREPERFHSARDLAASIGTTERRLSELCKFRHGVTMHRYMVEGKMRMAGQLLRDTQMPVSDIARYVGFHSACNFSVAFRHHAGASPTAFRATRQAAPAT